MVQGTVVHGYRGGYRGTGVGIWVQGGYMGIWVQWHVGCLEICIQTDNDVGDEEIFSQKIFSHKKYFHKKNILHGHVGYPKVCIQSDLDENDDIDVQFLMQVSIQSDDANMMIILIHLSLCSLFGRCGRGGKYFVKLLFV